MNVSIIIPNYNGKHLLERNLPALFKALENFKGEYEVIIVDDGSTDDSAGFIDSTYKQVRTISLGKNYGFSYACNTGVARSKYEIVYLLNSDVEAADGFLEPLLEHFSGEDVFAVSSIEANGDDRCVPLVKFKFGIFWYWYENLPAGRESSIDLFVTTAGHTAFDKRKFLELNGFDLLFSPFYAEDGDICWRAWKRGWRTIMEPRSLVAHSCHETIGKFYSDSFIKKIHWKNRILMTWKNLSSVSFIVRHIFFLLLEFLFMPVFGKKEFSLGAILALKQWPQMMISRRRDRIKSPVYSDRELFTRFSRIPKSPVKILYLHETSQFSGGENSLFNLAIRLDKKKFSADFVLPGDGPFAFKLKEAGINVKYIKFPRIFNFFAFCGSLIAVIRSVKGRGIGIIHSNSIRTHLYSSLAGRLCGVPVVWHERNLISNEIIDPEKLLEFLPDRIICNSRAIASRFLTGGKLPAKVRVVYNGVDTVLFNPSVSGLDARKELGISRAEIVVGIASRLNRSKGHELFLKAAKALMDYSQPIKDRLKFLIAGSPVFEADRYMEGLLKNMVNDLGLSGKVVFAGFREEMPEIYAAMDIFVLASYAEPCGRVIFEAMSSGRPVVATNSGGTPEIVEDGVSGFLFEPGDFKALADKIASLAADPASAKRAGGAGRRRMEEKFSIERNVGQIQDIYMELERDAGR